MQAEASNAGFNIIKGEDNSLSFALHRIQQQVVPDVNNQVADAGSPFAGNLDIHYHNVTINGQEMTLGETLDFSRADPWSELTINAVKTLHEEGAFKGDITILEAGVGDGRNLLQVSHATYQQLTVLRSIALQELSQPYNSFWQ